MNCGRDTRKLERGHPAHTCRRDVRAPGLLCTEEKVGHVRDGALGRGDPDTLRLSGEGLQPFQG